MTVRLPDIAVNVEGDITQLAMLAEVEPVTVEQALKKKHWKEAILKELKSIEKNKKWKLVHFPQNKKSIDLKWVFKTKLKPDGQVEKYKDMLVARGFLHKYGQDYY